jgi:hypothetical protein
VKTTWRAVRRACFLLCVTASLRENSGLIPNDRHRHADAEVSYDARTLSAVMLLRSVFWDTAGALAVTGVLAGVVAIACAGDPSPSDEEKLHLYLLIGQSNMVGRDAPSDEDRQPHARIIAINRDEKWEPARDPLPHTDLCSEGVGPGMTFGRMMAKRDDAISIGLIPCAKGGSNLDQWAEGSKLYKLAVKRSRAAQRDGVLKGIIWHQGESETGNAKAAQSYTRRAIKIFTALRRDLERPKLPIVVGELAHYLYVPQRCPYARQVNAALAQIPKQLKHVGLATAEELAHKGDDVHMDAKSQRKMGKRYAQAMARLQACDEEQEP